MRRSVVGLVAGCVGLALAGVAAAGFVTATSGSLTLQSDPGDYVGQGQAASFSAPADTFLSHVTATASQTASVRLR